MTLPSGTLNDDTESHGLPPLQDLAVGSEPLDAFLDRLQPKLRRVLIRQRIPLQDVEDVLQQCLLALVYQWDHIRDPEPWLLGTLRNKCLVYWRDYHRRRYDTVDTQRLEWLAPGELPHQEHQDLRRDLDGLMEHLPPRAQAVIRLRYRLGYEPPEIARELGYQPSSMGKITSRSLSALGREMVRSGFCTRDELQR